MNKTVLFIYSAVGGVGLACSYQRAMESLGFRVVQFDLEAERVKTAALLGPLGPRLIAHLDFFALNAKANRALVMKALEVKPAVVIVTGVAAVRPATLVQLKISVPGVRLVNLFPDMLFNMHDSMFSALPLYDLFTFHTRAGVPILRELGCRGAFYLPFAADPTLHRPQPLTAEDRSQYACDVVYVGNHRPEHAALFSSLEGMDLKIWGPTRWRQAPRGSWVRSRWQGRPLYNGTEYSKAHLAAKVCLSPLDPLDLPGHNMRVFELPACGVFSLVTRTEEVLELFREGETVACFDGRDELRDKVRYYLAHPEERERIAKAAYEHVIRGGHTFRERAETLLGALGMGDRSAGGTADAVQGHAGSTRAST